MQADLENGLFAQANIVSVGYGLPGNFPVAATTYRFTSINSGKVLDADNCGTANGTHIDQWAALGNTCQQWNIAPSPAARRRRVPRRSTGLLI